MTDKHPTDALPMPETKLRFEVALTPLGERLDYTANQLRAERIAAYNLGRESMREEAAKKCEAKALKAKTSHAQETLFGLTAAIRSIEL